VEAGHPAYRPVDDAPGDPGPEARASGGTARRQAADPSAEEDEDDVEDDVDDEEDFPESGDAGTDEDEPERESVR